MDRRNFLKSATVTGLTLGLYKANANASIPEHNWDKYDWGSGPQFSTGFIRGRSRNTVHARLFRIAMSR